MEFVLFVALGFLVYKKKKIWKIAKAIWKWEKE